MLRFDSQLIEATVFVAARRDARRERELHRRIDPLYALADTRQREALFRQQYTDLFVSWRLAGPVESLLAEQPTIEQRTAHCIVRHAIRTKDETTELLVRRRDGRDERSLLIALRPETFLDTPRLGQSLRRELLRVADMLDEIFAYDPQAWPAGLSQGRDNLVRDRFSVLWDTYIDGRLARRGHGDDQARAHRVRQIERAFRGERLTDHQAEQAVADVWQSETLTFPDLLRLAESSSVARCT